VAKFDPKQFGLPRHVPNQDVPAIPALPKRKAKAPTSWDEADDAAWRAYDVTMVVSDGDRELSDRAYQAIINQQRRTKHGKEHPQHRNARQSQYQFSGDEEECEGRGPKDRG
jgi:hypothetical protein